MNMAKSPLLLILLLTCTCNGTQSVHDNAVQTVDQLVNNPSKYASRIIDVRGEIVMDYHGPTLCDSSGTPCFFITLPKSVLSKPNFELDRDHLYEEYERLSSEIGLVQKKLGKAKLMVTLRGRFDSYVLSPEGREVIVQNPRKGSPTRCRFVLQRVLKLDVQKLK